MKKVLLVIDNLGSGGAQNQLTLLASGLKELGHDVSVFTYFPQDFFKKRLETQQIKHFQATKKDKLGIGVIRTLIRHINQEKYDTIISFLDTPNFYAAIAKTFASHKPKLIISYRSKTEFEKLSWANLNIKKWTNHITDVIIANSNHERERWQEKFPKNRYKWKTIFNAVDNNIWEIDNSVTKKNRFLVVGSVSADKNGLLIIEALHLLQNRGIEINLTWIGEKIYHIQERYEYLLQMEAKIAEYKLESNWEWQKPTTQITDFYQSHKALILASKVEGMPNVVCEALSCAVPCLVSNVLDHPKLVFPNQNGYLFEPDEVTSLAEAILNIEKQSAEEYEKMSTNAFNFARSTFKKEVFTAQFEQLL